MPPNSEMDYRSRAAVGTVPGRSPGYGSSLAAPSRAVAQWLVSGEAPRLQWRARALFGLPYSPLFEGHPVRWIMLSIKFTRWAKFVQEMNVAGLNLEPM